MALTLARGPAPGAERVAVAPPRAPRTDRFSPQIQGLRAVAVVSVVLYHLWPDRLRGGYVGVDVFFVISGFLICGHLLRELESTGRIRLATFWARRIRRLLPAAFLVLAVSIAFVVVAMPAFGWAQNLSEIRAAGAYVENWQLAADAIDYLAAENSPSLVQHFWSLSVEEQFYFFQPLLLVAAFALGRNRKVVVGALTAVVVVSLGYSILLTMTQPGIAYFSTGTRAWEFALGGLVAAVPLARNASAQVRAALGWCGLALIGFALLFYTEATPFPGWTAAVPVLGTALVLAAGDARTAWAPGRLLGTLPFRRIGDWSYSIYLWHWPLIVAVPVVLGRASGWKIKTLILVGAVLLAVLTKRFVEDRWRRAPKAGGVARTYIAMVVAVGTIAVATTGAAVWQDTDTATRARSAQTAIASAPAECVGIQAVVHSCARPYAVTDTVVPAVAADDVPWNRGVAASSQCPGESSTSAPIAHACVFNKPLHPARTVVLVGDSHADHFIDALNMYAAEHAWRFITYTREGCSGIPSRAEPDPLCREWSAAVHAKLLASTDIDAVVVSAYASHEPWTVDDAVRAWKPLLTAGMDVVALRDVPGMPDGTTAPACVAAHLREYDPCTTPVPPEGKTEVAARAVGMPSVGVNDLLCQGGRCHAVIGGLIVYMDEAHLTLTFEHSLSEVLGSRVAAAFDRQRGAGTPS